ncbi:MAG TPA: hypothetical protein VIX35_11260, partial [Vicinamibacterales bacterium]
MKGGAGGCVRRERCLRGLIATGAMVLGVGLLAARPPVRSHQPQVPLHRIVSLIPAVTEMLFDISAGDDVVGVSSFDHYPPAVEARTRVGGLVDPD